MEIYEFYESVVSEKRQGEVIWNRRVNQQITIYITKSSFEDKYNFDISREDKHTKLIESEFIYNSLHEVIDAAEAAFEDWSRAT